MENLFNGKLFSLFPVPVFCPDEKYILNNEELDFVKKQSTYPNIGQNCTTIDTEILNKKELLDLKIFLQKQIDNYAKTVFKIDYNKCQILITQSWINYNKKGTSHHPHQHPNSLISGVFYIQGNESPIYFQRNEMLFQPLKLPITDYSNYITAENYSFINQKGTMYLFPSNLRHFVEENKSDEIRISLSFNTFVKGQLGTESTLDKLEIK
jgi:uncharacterized protein (TIGR02466 family)